MAKVRELFRGWYRYDTREFNSILRNGIISLDTNVLLNLYRYSKESSEEALNRLNDIKDRLIISYYVAFEFTKDREKTAADSLEDYFKWENEISKKYDDIVNILQKIPNKKMLNKDEIIADISKDKDKIISLIDNERNKKEALLNSGLEKKICDLLDDRIIDKYDDDAFLVVKAEGIRRQKEQIPPGYKDEKKGENADYHIFSQLIDYSKTNKKDVIFVTDDVKEDMFKEIHGVKTPRAELLQEFYDMTGCKLIILTFQDFLNNKIIFKDKVSDELLEEVEFASKLHQISKLRESNRVKRLLNRSFKHKSIDEVQENIDEIKGSLKAAIEIMKRPISHRFTGEYQYLLNLLEDNNIDDFFNASMNYRRRIIRDEEQDIECLSLYHSKLSINSELNFLIGAFNALIDYIECYLEDCYENNRMCFSLRQARNALAHGVLSNKEAMDIFNKKYEMVLGGIQNVSI